MSISCPICVPGQEGHRVCLQSWCGLDRNVFRTDKGWHEGTAGASPQPWLWWDSRLQWSTDSTGESNTFGKEKLQAQLEPRFDGGSFEVQTVFYSCHLGSSSCALWYSLIIFDTWPTPQLVQWLVHVQMASCCSCLDDTLWYCITTHCIDNYKHFIDNYAHYLDNYEYIVQTSTRHALNQASMLLLPFSHQESSSWQKSKNLPRLMILKAGGLIDGLGNARRVRDCCENQRSSELCVLKGDHLRLSCIVCRS